MVRPGGALCCPSGRGGLRGVPGRNKGLTSEAAASAMSDRGEADMRQKSERKGRKLRRGRAAPTSRRSRPAAERDAPRVEPAFSTPEELFTRPEPAEEAPSTPAGFAEEHLSADDALGLYLNQMGAIP